MNKFNNAVAVVTGAGSGIGRELALQLADAGAKLAISDINETALEAVTQEIIERSAEVLSTKLDVANQDAVFEYADAVANHYGKVNLVINNAGVGLASGSLWETEIEDFKWLMDINFYGVLYGTKAFLPYLQKSDWGHVVNLSSVFGIIAVPTQTAYNASKFAVRGLTEALHQELQMADGNVKCTSVHPGGIKTNIARSARITEGSYLNDKAEHEKAVQDFDKVARTTAESAARQILKAVDKGQSKLLIGTDAKLIDIIQRMFPRGYGAILRRFLPNKEINAKPQ